MAEALLTLTVKGETVAIEPSAMLVDVLGRLGLLGVKEARSKGECGACAVR